MDVFVPSAGPRPVEAIEAHVGRAASDLRFHVPFGTAVPGVAAVELHRDAAAADPEYFDLVRELADETAERLDRVHPGVFDRWLPDRNLRDGFRFVLMLRLGVTILPDVLAFLSREARSTALLADTLLTSDQVSKVERHLGQRPSGAACISTLNPRTLRRLGKRLGQGELSQLWPEDVRPGGALLLCGARSEHHRLHALAAVLERVGPTTVLVKGDGEEAVATAQSLATNRDATVITAAQFASFPMADEDRAGVKKALLSAAKRQDELAADDRSFALPHLVTLSRLATAGAGWEALIGRIRPRVVVGALDRSAFSPVAARFGARRDYVLVDVQHGIIAPQRVMDLVSYDAVLAWNERSRLALVEDGYATRKRIRVVGDPLWEHSRSPSALAQTARDLLAWRGTGRLVLAFPQPAKGPFISVASATCLFDWLSDLLAREPTLKMAIRPRSERDGGFPDALASLLAEGRVRVVSPTAVSLPDLLTAGDLAVSAFSSALVDALAAGVPAVSVDPDGIVPRLGLAAALPAARTSDDFQVTAMRALEHPPLVDPNVVPNFHDTYDQRITHALASVGAIPRQSALGSRIASRLRRLSPAAGTRTASTRRP